MTSKLKRAPIVTHVGLPPIYQSTLLLGNENKLINIRVKKGAQDAYNFRANGLFGSTVMCFVCFPPLRKKVDMQGIQEYFSVISQSFSRITLY